MKVGTKVKTLQKLVINGTSYAKNRNITITQELLHIFSQLPASVYQVIEEGSND